MVATWPRGPRRSSSALLGRALLLGGDLGPAGRALDRSSALVEREGWVALLPLPEALRAEVALLSGDLDRSDVLRFAPGAIGLLRAFAKGSRGE